MDLKSRLCRPLHGENLASAYFPRRQARHIKFGSKSELACAVLMEEYIPGWRCEQGDTFQIPIGPKRIDFRVGSSFIEYHPITVLHELENRADFREFMWAIQPLERHRKNKLFEILKKDFACKYWKRRRQVLDAAGHQRAELILIQTPEEFCRRVLRRFGNCQDIQAAVRKFHQVRAR